MSNLKGIFSRKATRLLTLE